MVENDPFVPESFGKNTRGMQANGELDDAESVEARQTWIVAMTDAIAHARSLAKLGVHKQLANRLIEPWCWQTIIVSSTEWDNFWGLRRNSEAQPEIHRAADLMYEAYNSSRPCHLNYGDWHLPLLQPDETVLSSYRNNDDPNLQLTIEQACKVSSGRCARISYLTHDGKRDVMADIELCEKLISSGHMSPLEHVARPMKPYNDPFVTNNMLPEFAFCGNFRGWVQYRKTIKNESNFLARSK
jgi:thymidylate synthase ThyX